MEIDDRNRPAPTVAGDGYPTRKQENKNPEQTEPTEQERSSGVEQNVAVDMAHKSYTCGTCEKSYTSYSSYYSHCRAHHFTPRVKCPLFHGGVACDKVFISHGARDHHAFVESRKISRPTRLPKRICVSVPVSAPLPIENPVAEIPLPLASIPPPPNPPSQPRALPCKRGSLKNTFVTFSDM